MTLPQGKNQVLSLVRRLKAVYKPVAANLLAQPDDGCVSSVNVRISADGVELQS